MFRCVQRLLASSVSRFLPRATYKNYVMSEELADLEKYCDTICIHPRKILQKVAVVGAGSDVGRIVSLLLKQHNVVKILALYDDVLEHKVVGVAQDLSHIDTSTAVEVYQGKNFLRYALDHADVVLICGGRYMLPPLCTLTDRELFFQNILHVRSAALAITSFCPYAFVAVQTPPVDCNYALVKHVFKKAGIYNPTRLIGVNSVNAMRANQVCGTYAKTDPTDSIIPVVGGTGKCTRVPVFSASKYYYCLTAEEKSFLTQLVRDTDNLICRVKGNYEQGHLSIGFATARCVLNIMLGLFEKPAFIDSALVAQDDPGRCYGMRTCSTPITIGRRGIQTYHVPTLTSGEMELLEDSKWDLEDMLNLGRCYAIGDEYTVHPAKITKLIPPKSCDEPECTPCC